VKLGTRESFSFVRISNRIGHPICFRIEYSNRISRYIPRKPKSNILKLKSHLAVGIFGLAVFPA